MPEVAEGRAEPESIGAIGRQLSPQTLALRFVAVLLIVGAAALLGTILVPFFLALSLAIAMSPLVSWMERRGVPTVVGSLACMLAVAAVLMVTLGLMVFQAGTILRDSDDYLRRMAGVVSRVSGRVDGDQVMESLGLLQAGDPGAGVGSGSSDGVSGGGPAGSAASWEGFLRDNLRAVGRWIVTGLGGLVGVLVGGVVFLAYLFYMLQARVDWTERLTLAFARLGLRPERKYLRQSQREIEIYVGFVSLVAASYVVVGSLFFWLIGLPQPLLWGLLTGLLEFIPFFGPTIAGTLITLVALSLGSLWQPLAVLGFFLVLHLIEGYVITPMVYGTAVEIDPVTTLFGVLFFGWIWGPIGSMLAMPMMILIRGLIVMTPDTPALDAIADVEDRKDEPARGRRSGAGAATP